MMTGARFHNPSSGHGAGAENFRSAPARNGLCAGILLTLVFVFIGGFGRVQAESEALTTVLPIDVDAAKGADLRPRVDSIQSLIESRQLDEAEQQANELRKLYESQFDPALTQYTFQSASEYEEFRTSPVANFEWIDWGYKQCLQSLAFIAAERRDFPKALAILATLEIIAPISSETAVEIGFVLNQMGKPEQAIEEYGRARSLALRYPTQKPYLALAMRGIGFALIELERLDEAEQIFKESLAIDPGNRVAANELNYIRDLRGSRKHPRASH